MGYSAPGGLTADCHDRLRIPALMELYQYFQLYRQRELPMWLDIAELRN
jgi:hypothetical protein